MPVSGEWPWTTATGSSDHNRTGLRPTFLISAASASVPTMSTGAPGRQALRQQAGGALRTGDDVVGLGGEAHGTQVLGNLTGSA